MSEHLTAYEGRIRLDPWGYVHWTNLAGVEYEIGSVYRANRPFGWFAVAEGGVALRGRHKTRTEAVAALVRHYTGTGDPA